jgi:biotin transport system substrate-specific component
MIETFRAQGFNPAAGETNGGDEIRMMKRSKDIAMVSLFAALTAAGAFLKIPFPHVPLTMQTLMVMFAGLILGSRLGALSQFLYLVTGLLGLPIFAQGGGPGYVMQPSFGFLIGFIAGAYVTGKMTEGREEIGFFRLLAALVLGQLAIYAFGIPHLFINLNYILKKPASFSTVMKIGFLHFLPGDILKTLLAITVLAPIRQRILRLTS